ncbi:MAG TPA: response regulator, partial [Pirellulaceae bacterium]
MRVTSPQILITDDDRDMRESLRASFESRGMSSSVAADGYEALSIVRSRPVHLILLDLQMPGLTGLDTVRVLRSERAALPWILVSGAIDDQILAEAAALQVQAVIPKPIRMRDTTSRVLHLLRELYGWEPPL